MGVIATNTSGFYTSFSSYPLKNKLSASATGFSFSFWIKPNAAPVSSPQSGLVYIGDNPQQFGIAFGWDNSNTLYQGAVYFSFAPYTPVTDPAPPSDNAWHQYVFTYTISDTSMRLYRDGTLVGGPVVTAPVLSTSYNEYVAILSNSLTSPNTTINLNIGVAELAVWNVPLTTGDVTSLYAGTLPTSIRVGYLQCFWTLYGPSGTQTDFSGNGVLGVLNSGGTIGIYDASNSFASGRPTYPTIVVPGNPVTPLNRLKVIGSVANPSIGGGGPTPPSHGQGFPTGL